MKRRRKKDEENEIKLRKKIIESKGLMKRIFDM